MMCLLDVLCVVCYDLSIVYRALCNVCHAWLCVRAWLCSIMQPALYLNARLTYQFLITRMANLTTTV